MIVSLIAAMSTETRGIGWRGALPWRLPKDLQRFRRLTMGHALIFGRKTYDSLGGRELPGRRLIVLTRRRDDGPPAAAGAGLGHGHLGQAPFQLARFVQIYLVLLGFGNKHAVFYNLRGFFG